jgi:glycine hydroxymethyltransferase
VSLKTTDKAIFAFIEQEQERQEEQINLIASENYTPLAVLQATASVLTNKYAEGYPGKRYYAGCNLVDQVEQLAINRCKHLFGADHANVQPHAGSQANMAVYTAILKPGDTIMGMSLSAGGHLTHGHTVNFSGIYYKSIQYGVDPDTEQLNYDTIASLAEQHKPKLIVVGASAYSRIINFEHIAQIATNVGAYLLADIAHIAGLIATGLHPSPIPYADFVSSTTHKTLRGPRGGLVMSKKEYASHIDRAIMPGTQGGPFMHSIAAKAVAFHLACQPTFKVYQQQVINNAKKMAQLFTHLGYRIVAGGTDNHLFIVDLRSKNITGRAAEIALEQAGITVSRSCIPFDPAKPWITSGIRLGTPAIATRGMKEQETEQIVYFIDEVIKYHNNQLQLQRIKQQVKKLCMQFPIYNQNALHNPLSFTRMFENSSL